MQTAKVYAAFKEPAQPVTPSRRDNDHSREIMLALSLEFQRQRHNL